MKKKKYRNIKKKQLQTKYMLVIMSCVCGLMFFLSLMFNLKGGPLKTIAGYIFVPMQEGINTTGAWVFEKANDFRTLSDVLDENEKLKEQVDELTTLLTTTKLEQYELDNYRELFDLDQKYPSYEKVAASVIAKDSGNWFDTFTINRGTNHGLSIGMNVIAGSGLVGIITDVGPNYAKVRSIINDSNNVSAMIATTGDNFNVSGNLKSMNETMTITFSGLKDANNQVKTGDPVVTSYVSDQYQQGILIGYITSIENSSNNLTKSGTITPVVDFAHLEDVLVITKLKDIGGNHTQTPSSEQIQNTETSTQSED
ncbi:MAG: rod shape-determining protein MreC [Lachnospiraceae bacterium]|nr:rod shape-determining protein MreC [Lachnospiraceae bacterium]